MTLRRLVKKRCGAVDWTLGLFFPKDLVQIVTLPAVKAPTRNLEVTRSDIQRLRTEPPAPAEIQPAKSA
ncbi:MAG: hypothetical protein H0X40_16995 [Chthoniobacterales bacterium]|nr:hypothetical protein [Chthoniobacterales bacterium]